LVLEARGLDVTPATVADMSRAGDEASAALLERIYRDEIGHVAAGIRWYETFAREAGHDPQLHWQALLRQHFRGTLKPPFNDTARAAAGMPSGYYRQ
jgi:uncharacterized ferritin-like protein (DUF455 family)